MEGYSVTILEAPENLTARDRVKVKDFSAAVQFDKAVNGEDKLVVDVDYVCKLGVHNEKSKEKDYIKYVYVDKGGTMFVSGSESLYTSYIDIKSEMGDEPFQIEVYRLESKNYNGKTFLTCTIV